MTCPVMSAGSQYVLRVPCAFGNRCDAYATSLLSSFPVLARWTYLWADGVVHKRPIKVSAPDYMQYMMSWVESQLDNPKKFPLSPPFPPTFVAELSKIYNRMFRGYAHMFHHHADDFEALGATEHLFHCFKHFVTYAQEYDLLRDKEKEPLKDLIESLAFGDGPLDALIKVPASATAAPSEGAKDREETNPPVAPPLPAPEMMGASAAAAAAAAAPSTVTIAEDDEQPPADTSMIEECASSSFAEEAGPQLEQLGSDSSVIVAADEDSHVASSITVKIVSFEADPAGVVWYKVILTLRSRAFLHAPLPRFKLTRLLACIPGRSMSRLAPQSGR